MQPSIFIGHGSPMNAISENSYTKALNQLGSRLKKEFASPEAVLCISAHWMTEGTWVTHMPKPKTIYDFAGFPEELFRIKYPATGHPQVAELVAKTLTLPAQLDDHSWGLDHGAWSVLRHVYPAADVPVVQLSLDMTKPPEFHFSLGEQLRALRSQGVLILGSGNIVHNLRKIQWQTDAPSLSWALEFDEWCKRCIENRDFKALVHDYLQTEPGRLSVPTPDHYYPLLYCLGASSPNDKLDFVFEGLQNASISMRSLIFF